MVRALSSGPERADAVYFGFPAWIEICRQRTGVEIPFDLKRSYFEALGRLPELVAAATGREWDSAFLVSALAAIAAVKGPPDVAEAVLELSPEVAADFLRRHFGE